MNSAVIVAAGRGERFGQGEKQFAPLLDRPVLWHAVAAFGCSSSIDHIVIVTREELIPQCLSEVADAVSETPLTVVGGREDRQGSVLAGLDACPEETALVWIHDGDRPLITVEAIDESAGRRAGLDGLIFASPVVDTLKEVEGGVVTATRPRERFFRAETPQLFPFQTALAAHERAADDGFAGTDDAALVERYGGRVGIFEHGQLNIKVTTVDDLFVIEQELRRRQDMIGLADGD